MQARLCGEIYPMSVSRRRTRFAFSKCLISLFESRAVMVLCILRLVKLVRFSLSNGNAKRNYRKFERAKYFFETVNRISKKRETHTERYNDLLPVESVLGRWTRGRMDKPLPSRVGDKILTFSMATEKIDVESLKVVTFRIGVGNRYRNTCQ